MVFIFKAIFKEYLYNSIILKNIFLSRNYKFDFITKEVSFCHKLKYSYPYILATQCRRPKIFQTVNSVRSNSLSLKYQRFMLTGCRDKEIKKFEVVAKTQFL